MKAFFLQLYLLAAFFLYTSTTSASLNCAVVLNSPEIALGEQVDIEVKIKNMRRLHRKVVFIGESSDPKTETKKLIFSDLGLNLYYFDSSAVKINGLPADRFDFSLESLPSLIKQTEGSCNLCANISAINQLALDSSENPISIPVTELEYSKTADIFSAEASLRLFLKSLYDKIWPDGYVTGEVRDIDKTILKNLVFEYMMRNMNAMTRSLEFADLGFDLGYINLPVSINSRHSTDSQDFLNHLNTGGTAVVSGALKPGRVVSTLDMTGEASLTTIFVMQPYPFVEDQDADDAISEFIDSAGFNVILDRIKKGEVPTRQLVLDAIKQTIERPGHAVAAIRLIDDGPLKDFVVVINSWGTFEVHPVSNFRKNLNYVLISKS